VSVATGNARCLGRTIVSLGYDVCLWLRSLFVGGVIAASRRGKPDYGRRQGREQGGSPTVPVHPLWPVHRLTSPIIGLEVA